MGVADRYDPNTDFRLSRDRIPSPGRYDQHSSLHGPHYSIRLKNERKNYIQTPGPGFYEPDSSGQNESFTKPAFHYTVSESAKASLTNA